MARVMVVALAAWGQVSTKRCTRQRAVWPCVLHSESLTISLAVLEKEMVACAPWMQNGAALPLLTVIRFCQADEPLSFAEVLRQQFGRDRLAEPSRRKCYWRCCCETAHVLNCDVEHQVRDAQTQVLNRGANK